MSFVFVIFVIVLLLIYWFVPLSTIEFATDSNFQKGTNNSFAESVQFYENMRFSNPNISYQIYDCPLKKKNDMEQAFGIVSDSTILNFYAIDFGEEIFVTCDSKNKIEDGLFIAGEGGPVNITKGDVFNVILKGKILLIKDSTCETPNVALHELFHVLGFGHSDNPGDLMYPVSKCSQTINPYMLEVINELYSTPSEPDLAFSDVSAVMNGKYLDINMSIKNNGLKESGKTEILIYADEKIVKEIELEELEIGYGRLIALTNLWINQINIESLEIAINSNFSELEKNNNRIKLGIKNKN
ncbi:MAG: matrixin family metalloprotease [bacterium]